jgi:UDP-GlcNAc:undecaprenyl-phosphate/decaprenyl-phosphate GlcNAc-1-phosphate transferase
MLPWAASGLVIATLFITASLTPLVLKLCYHYHLFDRLGGRKIHQSNIPRLGGVALFGALVLTSGLLALGVVADWFDLSPAQAQLVPVIFLGLCGFFTIGFVDDLRSLPALPRLMAQLSVALAVVWCSGPAGVRITALFGHTVLPEWASITLTVLWIVGIVNTFNWIDGLDGLAAGLGGIAGTAFLVIALARPLLPNAPLTIALAAMLVGAVLGFIPYNFQPARIFIGDGGAFSLGYLLAVISVIGLFKQAALISFIVPVCILALPITDTAFAILRRAFKGEPITKPDNRHIHHRMLALLSRRYRRRLTETQWTALQEQFVTGLAHRNTVLALYAFAALFAALAVVLGVGA